jgi:putative hydrolase of the HAD superfamily
VIRAVFFDLDGVLHDRDTSVRTLIAQQYDLFAPAFRHVSKDDFIKRFLDLDARGYTPKDKVYQQLVTECRVTEVGASDLYEYFYATYHRCCTPFADLHGVIARLRTRDLRLGIITNGGHQFQMRTIEALGLAHYFTAILTSEGEGLKKPDVRLFLRATQRLGVAPPEAVFVGDHPTVDIAGAREAGLKAIWKRDPFWEPPLSADGVIDHLSELETQLVRFM